MSRRDRVLVIGLDGGTFDVLDPRIRRGALPNLAALIRRGARGTLRAVVPPVTGPNWVSMMTGVNPGRHGVFDFSRPAAGGRRIVHAGDIRARTLWSVLHEQRKTIGVFNVPVTFPPAKVNGFMISGFLAPDARSGISHPPELIDELRRENGEYLLDIDFLDVSREGRERLLRQLLASVEQRGRNALYLMRKYDWDFFMAVFAETDRLFHAFWSLLEPPEGNGAEPADAAARELAERCLAAVDAQVGALCAEAGDEATVLVVSDHGFGPLNGVFYVNRWLADQGLLALKPEHTPPPRAGGAGQALRKAGRKLDILGLRRVLRRPAGRDGWTDRLARTFQSFHDRIDWGRTRAYYVAPSALGIHLNLQGREPHGIVRADEAEAVRSQVIAGLRSVRDPATGDPLVTHLFRREEVFSGPYQAESPDLFFFLRGLEVLASPDLAAREWFGPAEGKGTGYHRMEGMLIAAGSKVRAGMIDDAEIIDVMPTVLHALGLSVPDDLDGKVLEELFDPSFREAAPVQFAPAAAWAAAEAALTPEEDAKVRERLQGLGYY